MWPLSEGDEERAIPDPAGQDGIAPEHVGTPIQYRSLDRAPRDAGA